MKTCRTCGQTKNYGEFEPRGKNRPGHFQADCRSCRQKANREWKRKLSDLVKRWKLRKGCQRCGFRAEHSVQLDLDHVVPKRSGGNDRQAINTSWSKKRLKEELTKCQVLCANCHRLKTFQDGTMFQKKDL